MEFDSVTELISEVYDKSVKGDKSLFYHNDTLNEFGKPVLTVGTMPVQDGGVELFVAVSVAEEYAENGIPSVLEESQYIEDFSDDWYEVNTGVHNLPVLELGELTFSHYDNGRAWYTQEFSEDNNIVQKLQSFLNLN